ncbi:hypothetical protein BASA60_006872 [Batrachochytrium salamandrivorans]|nr:hypothetical protein BASA60_006872 [Batrachochytrium salamandrivorans]
MGAKVHAGYENLFGSSTSHDPPQPDKIPLPARVGKAEAESYNQDQDIEQYNAFTENRHKKLAAAQCRSPRPSKLFVPYEVAVQMHLSRPGHENIYVPRVLDYITLENEFMLIMDYLDESWVSLASYMKEKIRLDIEDARNIIKEIINAAISLKQHGVFHNDIHSMYQ